MPQTLYKPLDQPFVEPLPRFENEQPEEPSFQEVINSTFAQTNIISNMIELNNKKTFPEQLGFDLGTSLKAKNLWDSPDRDNFIGVKSDSELDYRAQKIAKERHDQDVYARSGWPGYAALAMAGLADPTILIPFLKGPTIVRSAIKGAGLVGATVAGEELVMQQNQETRTPEEGTFAVAAATILGGIFGGAIHGLSRTDIQRMSDDMVTSRGDDTISTPHPPFDQESSLGAYKASGEGGKLKSTGNYYVDRITLDQAAKLSPVTRLIQQSQAPSHMPLGSPLAREIGSTFSQAGLKLEGNAAGFSGAPGGNIENVIKGYAGNLDIVSRAVERAFIDYATDSSPAKLFALTQAKLGAKLRKLEMDYTDFKTQVFLATANEGQHSNPFIAKAAAAVQKHIDELYDEGVEVKVFSGEEKVKGDKSYISHLWDTVKIKSNENALVKVLRDHYLEKKNADFAEAMTKLREKQSKARNFIADAERSEEEVEKLIEQFKNEMEELENSLPFDIAQARLEALNLREKAKKITDLESSVNRERKQALLDKAKKAEESAGPTLKQYNLDRSKVRERLNALRNARVVVDRKFAAKLEKIDRSEELQLSTMIRAAKQAQRFLALVSKASDKEVAQELSKLKSAFAQTVEAFDNAEEKIVKLTSDKDNAIEGVLEAQESRMNRLDDLAERIENVDSFDRAALVAEVDDVLRLVMTEHAEINARRAVRAERLRAQAKKLTPEEYQAKIDAKKAAAQALAPDFAERTRVGGGEKIDLEAGTADFTEHAEQLARDTVQKLKGTERRLAYSDIVQEKRGPELARLLDIPASTVLPWLETDIQRVLNVYTRTLAADNTIARAFGTSDMAEVMSKLTDEQNRAIAYIEGLKDKKGIPLTKEDRGKIEFATNAFYDQTRKDIYTLLERARGMRGIPTDPDAASARLGRSALDLNNVRYMGGAAIASIPDPARIVQRHSLLRTFRDGFIPFITQFKDFRLSAREAKLAGTANEIASHTRYQAMTNVFEDTYRGTLAERGLHFLSTRMGLMSGLSAWTQAWQSFSAVVINAKLMDSIAIMMGEKTTAGEVKKATEFLASVNITPDIAETIWRTADSGGVEKVGNVWLPNTEFWDVSQPHIRQARRAYRAALAGEVDDTIIRPGLERPSFVDANLGTRLFTQFKSFALSSTQKTVMAGLQEHDMAYVNGMMISLAMGALSYYLYAVAAGGKTYETMQKSIEDRNWQLWADEAISRSGQTAIFDSVQRVANRVPIINKVSSFSGGPRTKTIGGGLTEELTGPTGDLMRKLERIIQGYAEPSRTTVHNARQLLPFQNLFYTRRLLSQIENAAGDAFGLEGRKQ